jgi:Ca2+-binding RTX toxin-like protein
MVLVPPQVDVLVAAMAKVKQATLDSGMPAAVVTAITSAWQLDSVARHVIGSDLADTLGGGNGDDVFDGGGGNDDLRGNGGDDFFLQSLSTDSDSLDGGSGVNTVSYMGPDSYGSGISADLDAGRVDKLAAVGSQAASFDTLTNINNVIGSMGDDALFGNDRANGLDGSTGDDSLYGGAGDDTVLGGNGKDVLNGGTGNDILNGGAGADLYIFNAGDGSDTVTDNDATPNVTDQIYFGSGITADKLWFQHVGNDLLVSVIGTTDSVSVVDWYNGAAYQIEQFRAAGSLLLGSDVNSLVAAMAAFTPPVLGQATLPANYSPLTAARQAAWHTAP